MPNYKVHLIFGLFFFLIIFFLTNLNLKSFLIFFCICIIYSLLPDIDLVNSKSGKILRTVLIILSFILLIIGLYKIFFVYVNLIILFLLIILQLVKHRRFIHTFRASLLFSLPLLYLGINEFVFGCICYLLHLVIDKSLRF